MGFIFLLGCGGGGGVVDLSPCLSPVGKIEKSVSRISVWYHEACRVVTNSAPKGRFFLSYPHINNGFVFLPNTVFTYIFIYLKISFQKSLNILRCNFKG